MVVSEKFYIGYSDIDRKLCLSNTALLKIFENMACIHGALAGESIKTSSVRWFLTAYHVKIEKRPMIEERVEARTWSREMRGVSACREFEIYSENGERAVTAISNWACTESGTQKLLRITPEAMARYESEKERANFAKPWLEKLREPENYVSEREFTVERNLIDANDHMNNVFYLDLAALVLPAGVFAEKECDEFEIMYRRAVKLGEKVSFFYAEEEKAHIVAVKGENGDLCAMIKLYKGE